MSYEQDTALWNGQVNSQRTNYNQNSQSQRLFKTLDSRKHNAQNQENVGQKTWQARYQQLSVQMDLKESLIVELRSYQQVLLQQLNKQPQIQYLNEYKLKNQKLLDQIDQLEKEVKLKEDRLHTEILIQGELQKENMHLKQKYLQLEQQVLQQKSPTKKTDVMMEIKLLQHDFQQQMQHLLSRNKKQQKFVSSVVELVNSCYPSEYFGDTQPSLKTCWTWLKSVLQEYIQIKEEIQRK